MSTDLREQLGTVLALIVATGCSGPGSGGPLPRGGADLAVNLDQGAMRVIHVRDDHFSPDQVSVRVGETVRFVFDHPGHNATTVTSAGDMDPVWYPDRRGCSVAGSCETDASPAGSFWDYSFPYAADWPVLCGLHGLPYKAKPALGELVWVKVTP